MRAIPQWLHRATLYTFKHRHAKVYSKIAKEHCRLVVGGLNDVEKSLEQRYIQNAVKDLT